MKKYCFLMLLLFTSAFVFGQSLDDINKFMILRQNKKAKEMIDKYLSDAKNASKAEGWYYKGRIYNAVSKDSGTTFDDAMKLKTESFEALKKYQQLDAKDEAFTKDQHGDYFDLYNGYFEMGAKEFNNKNFINSFNGFKNALVVEQLISSKEYSYNGFKFSTFDTSLVINTAIAANQAKLEDSAAAYYQKIADAGIGGEQHLNIYEYLAEYYSKKNDDTHLNAILKKGSEIYPSEDYWTDFELEKLSKKGDKAALVAKYRELMNSKPTKFTYPYNLGVEMYNSLYVGDNRPANANAIKDSLTQVVKTAIALDKGIDGKMLMTRHLYNWAYDLQDSAKRIKGTKPADLKRSADIKALMNAKIDECIPYANDVTNYFAAIPTLKAAQKINYKQALDILSQFYETKGNAAKAAEYAKRKADVDK